jgi:hypothetical protein
MRRVAANAGMSVGSEFREVEDRVCWIDADCSTDVLHQSGMTEALNRSVKALWSPGLEERAPPHINAHELRTHNSDTAFEAVCGHTNAIHC